MERGKKMQKGKKSLVGYADTLNLKTNMRYKTFNSTKMVINPEVFKKRKDCLDYCGYAKKVRITIEEI